MSDRRVLCWTDTYDQALRRLPGWLREPGARVEQVAGRWAVTADKPKKGT